MIANIFSQILHRLLPISLTALVGVVGGTLATKPSAFNSNTSYQDTSFLFPEPESMEDLTEKANVIVIGTVGPIITKGSFVGYDEAGKLKKLDPTQPQSLALPAQIETPFVDYEIKVEQVLKSDGTIESGNPLIMRMPGDLTEQSNLDAEYPRSVPGDHRLLFLTQNKDKKTYGLYYGSKSRLIVDGPTVTSSNGRRTPVNLNAPGKPVEFIETLKAVIQKQKNP